MQAHLNVHPYGCRCSTTDHRRKACQIEFLAPRNAKRYPPCGTHLCPAWVGMAAGADCAASIDCSGSLGRVAWPSRRHCRRPESHLNRVLLDRRAGSGGSGRTHAKKTLYQQPTDIEWAFADGVLYMLHAQRIHDPVRNAGSVQEAATPQSEFLPGRSSQGEYPDRFRSESA